VDSKIQANNDQSIHTHTHTESAGHQKKQFIRTAYKTNTSQSPQTCQFYHRSVH